MLTLARRREEAAAVLGWLAGPAGLLPIAEEALKDGRITVDARTRDGALRFVIEYLILRDARTGSPWRPPAFVLGARPRSPRV